MKWLNKLPLVISLVCLFTQCSEPSKRDGASANETGHRPSPLISVSDSEWHIRTTNTDGQKGQFSVSCSKTGYCWYWNRSSLWRFGEGGVIKVGLPLAENEHILNGFLLSTQVGWIASSSGLLQTSDGGSGWIRIPVPGLDSGKGRMHAVYFEDEKRGWVVGGEYRPRVDSEMVPNNAISDDRKSVLAGTAKRTVDGGLHWETTRLAKSAGRFDRVVFSGNNGLLSGDAGLQTTRDGGKSWTDALSAFSSPDTRERPEVKTTFLLDERRGWVSLSGSELLTTENGMRSWRKIAVTVEFSAGDHSLDQIVFVNESLGLALQVHLGIGEIYRTRDAGKTWIPLNLKSNFSGLALVPGTKRIIALGDDGIFSFTPKEAG